MARSPGLGRHGAVAAQGRRLRGRRRDNREDGGDHQRRGEPDDGEDLRQVQHHSEQLTHQFPDGVEEYDGDDQDADRQDDEGGSGGPRRLAGGLATGGRQDEDQGAQDREDDRGHPGGAPPVRRARRVGVYVRSPESYFSHIGFLVVAWSASTGTGKEAGAPGTGPTVTGVSVTDGWESLGDRGALTGRFWVGVDPHWLGLTMRHSSML